jgi:hypothetical protein
MGCDSTGIQTFFESQGGQGREFVFFGAVIFTAEVGLQLRSILSFGTLDIADGMIKSYHMIISTSHQLPSYFPSPARSICVFREQPHSRISLMLQSTTPWKAVHVDGRRLLHSALPRVSMGLDYSNLSTTATTQHGVPTCTTHVHVYR